MGCEWVFTTKCNVHGSVERYKAKLLAKGFTKTYGIINYQEAFAPVAKINSIRILLSLSTNIDWPFHQLDVNNVLLNGDLEEDVFMSLPHQYLKWNLEIVKFMQIKEIIIWSHVSKSLVRML